MARKDLNTLKRSHICSILEANGWDYKDPSHSAFLFSKCLHEIFSWHYRKGNKLTPMMIQTVCETMCLKEKLSSTDTISVCMAVQKFITSKVYTKLQHPLIDYEGVIKIGKQNTLTYMIPTMDESDKGFTVILTNPIYKTPEDLANSFEGRFLLVWFFYGRNRYVDIHNIYYEDGDYKAVHYKPNEKSVRYAKKVINNMERLFYSYDYAAPTELCMGCSRRNECPKYPEKN